eukprot:m.59991 g.59991  ORF g.59991 m.59991 type:complete len:642 (-) comp13042_c0_seq2:240-2165(-)
MMAAGFRPFVTAVCAPWRRVAAASLSTASRQRPVVVGMDLGTTQSLVAVVEDGVPVVIPDAYDGTAGVPSVVAFSADSTASSLPLVGQAAKRQAVTNPENTVHAAKRLIGRPYSDPLVSAMQANVPYRITKGLSGEAMVEAGGRSFLPSQIAAYILCVLRDRAEQHLGRDVQHAVITVPAYFNDNQRQETKRAGQLAGLNVVRVVNEPTAAALSFGLSSKKSGTVAVFDLGGGTFDISILDIDDGMFQVKATNGDTFLGGEDFDNAIVEFLLQECDKQLSGDVRQSAAAMQRIREAAELAKMDLDTEDVTDVQLPFLLGQEHLSVKLPLETFNDLVSPLVERTLGPCKKCLADAGITVGQIDDVLLIGGMSKSRCVISAAKALFQKDPEVSVNPMQAVALGAAVQAGILTGEVEHQVLLDVTPLSLGIETLGGLFDKLLPRNTTVPTKVTSSFATGVDNQTQVEINVLQGERPIAADNMLLGTFVLSGIPPGPKGSAKVTVTFDVDANGILKVSGMVEGSDVKQELVVQALGELETDERDRLLAEAAEYRDADKERLEWGRALADAEVVLRDIEDHVDRFRARMDQNLLEELEVKLQGLLAELDNIRAGSDLERAPKLKDDAVALQPLALTVLRTAMSHSE